MYANEHSIIDGDEIQSHEQMIGLNVNRGEELLLGLCCYKVCLFVFVASVNCFTKAVFVLEEV